jgi:alpha-tubulin suppressor-like RCC1 family protein
MMIKPKTWKRFPAMTALALIASLGAAILPASPVHAAVTPMVSAGTAHTIGLKSDGTVVAVGDNTSGQCNVSSWTDITQVSAGGGHSIGLKSGNTVIAVGNNDAGQCDISTWTGITQVSAAWP